MFAGLSHVIDRYSLSLRSTDIEDVIVRRFTSPSKYGHMNLLSDLLFPWPPSSLSPRAYLEKTTGPGVQLY
jgi:hypothetical protein